MSAEAKNSLAFRRNTRSGKGSKRRCSGFLPIAIIFGKSTSSSTHPSLSFMILGRQAGHVNYTNLIGKAFGLCVAFRTRLTSLAGPAFFAYLEAGAKLNKPVEAHAVSHFHTGPTIPKVIET